MKIESEEIKMKTSMKKIYAFNNFMKSKIIQCLLICSLMISEKSKFLKEALLSSCLVLEKSQVKIGKISALRVNDIEPS